jgi:hypothetical protein
MLREMGSRELSGWIAYSELEPFGEERGDLRAGIVASTIVNVNRGANSEACKPSDFMPDFSGERAEREEGEAEAKHIEAMMKGFEALRVAGGGQHIHRGVVVE